MQSYTINEFCQRQRCSRSHYYKLEKAGKGPRTMRLLGCVRISEDAEREWVKAREAEAASMEAA